MSDPALTGADALNTAYANFLAATDALEEARNEFLKEYVWDDDLDRWVKKINQSD